MSKYSLIKQLNEAEKQKDAPKSTMPTGLPYQEYEIEVDGKERLINIPLREADAFETAVSEMGEIDGPALKTLLRQFRGLRG